MKRQEGGRDCLRAYHERRRIGTRKEIPAEMSRVLELLDGVYEL